jgi:hypothetical protein
MWTAPLELWGVEYMARKSLHLWIEVDSIGLRSDRQVCRGVRKDSVSVSSDFFLFQFLFAWDWVRILLV